MTGANADPRVISDFGEEWSSFDQSGASYLELERIFEAYFSLFPWEQLAADAEGFDLGCGSGRWAYFCAPKVGRLHCVDPAERALEVARRTLEGRGNCQFHQASVDDIPLEDGSMDFGYSLGVLHHVPDTAAGLRDCVSKLKPGAPFLLYLYYALDNRPLWFRALWRASDLARRVISKLPRGPKRLVTESIALGVYWPLSRIARIADAGGLPITHFPLSAYRDKDLYTLRTDALDRFGTRLEQRFTKHEIERMMSAAGLNNIEFAGHPPYWCALGYRSDGQAEAQ